MEKENSWKQLKDIVHENHQPLVLKEEPWDERKQTRCSACKDLLFYGESYSCEERNGFHLHKRCAEIQYEIKHHPVHQKHSRLFLNGPDFSSICDFCKKKGTGFFYSCERSARCFSLDIKCALFLLAIDENNETLELDYHPHPLFVVENYKNDQLKGINCNVCDEALLESICVCFDCRINLHKKCTELPPEINHPCHRRHPLCLDLNKIFSICEICNNNIVGLSYGCSSCEFDIHIKCASLGSFKNVGDRTHQHKFNLVWRQGSFICDACGTRGNHDSYVCSTCHVQVHKYCTSLPRLIRITRHYYHPLCHNYFVEGNDHLDQKHECRICYDEVKKEHGCYSCSREDCYYVVHVNCALVDGNYWVIDKDEPEDSAMESSLTRIIERNDNGEAVKIEHFGHEHHLMLGEEIINEGDIDKCCNGCILSLSGLFYYCSQCDFFLHKTCADLPRKKNHWFHQHSTALVLASTSHIQEEEVNDQVVEASILKCDFCLRVGSGLFYKCYQCDEEGDDPLIVCLRCASLPDALVHLGHNHLIFFDSKYRGECIGCGYNIRNGKAFRCKDCDDYGLDFKCLTLPSEVRHRADKHPLKLVYHDEYDDPEKHYCDICEEKRDPNRWFYLCSVCNNSFHPKCLLGKNPFIKIGSTLTDKTSHPHPLTFVRKVYYYPKCSKCGKPCVDLALECAQSECGYIIHTTCLS